MKRFRFVWESHRIRSQSILKWDFDQGLFSKTKHDKKYFGLLCDEIPGNSGFYTDNIEECHDDVRFKSKEKFPVKVLVKVAISSKGVSEPLIRPWKSVSINQNIYLTDCLQKRLLPNPKISSR